MVILVMNNDRDSMKWSKVTDKSEPAAGTYTLYTNVVELLIKTSRSVYNYTYNLRKSCGIPFPVSSRPGRALASHYLFMPMIGTTGDAATEYYHGRANSKKMILSRYSR